MGRIPHPGQHLGSGSLPGGILTAGGAREPVVGEARRRAAALMAELTAGVGGPIELRGIDLGPALEQQIYFALRDRREAARGLRAALVRWGVVPGALVASARPRRTGAIRRGGVLAIVRGELHARAFEPVAADLARRNGPSAAVVRVGQAAASKDAAMRSLPRLIDLLSPGWALAAVGHRRESARLVRIAAETDPAVGEVVREHLPRLVVAAAGIGSATDVFLPRMLVTYDEAGSWGRLIVAAGQLLGIPVVDLPHAEYAIPELLVGARFSAVGVYGPASRELAAAGGTPPERIHVVGSVRHDLLGARARAARAGEHRGPTLLAFAAQYPTAHMSEPVLVAALNATVRAAARLAPARVVVVPHPFGPPGLADRWAESLELPNGVAIEVAAPDGLHDTLTRADLLVTVASQSVLEAAVVGIPALAIQPPGATYIFPYAAEGIAAVARDAAELEAMVAELHDPALAAAAVERARAAVGRHLGPMDGGAARRSADLIEALLNRLPETPAGAPDVQPSR